MIKQNILNEKEREKLVEEITERVLNRLSVIVDTSDAVLKIKELKQEIDKLGKEGK